MLNVLVNDSKKLLMKLFQMMCLALTTQIMKLFIKYLVNGIILVKVDRMLKLLQN